MEKPLNRIQTIVDRDNMWVVGLTPTERDKSKMKLGVVFEDEDDQGNMFQVANHKTLDDAIAHIKDWYGGEERYKKAESSGVTLSFTDELAAIYPKEIKSLKEEGWFAYTRYVDTANFFGYLEDSGDVRFDIQTDKEGFEKLIADVDKVYEYKVNGNVDLISCSQFWPGPGKGLKCLAGRLTDAGYDFDHYSATDAFDSKEEALHSIRESLENTDEIKQIHNTLCEQFEEVWNEPYKGVNKLNEVDAKYSKSKDRSKSVDNEFGSIENGVSGPSLQTE